MNRSTRILLALFVLFSTASIALADRGTGKRTKNRAVLNINIPVSLRNSISFNLKNGLTYKGSLLSSQEAEGTAVVNNAIITYQKGNTIYIIPYKNKITMPEMRPGYTGIKLILNTKK